MSFNQQDQNGIKSSSSNKPILILKTVIGAMRLLMKIKSHLKKKLWCKRTSQQLIIQACSYMKMIGRITFANAALI